MDLKKVSDIIKSRNIQRSLYFVQKSGTVYTTYSPNVGKDVFDSLLNMANSYILNFADFEIVEYNPTGYRDGTLEVCKAKDIENYQDIVQNLEGGNIEDIEENADRLSFYCMEFTDIESDANIKLMRRVTKFKKLYSKGILAAFTGNTLNKINSKMLGIDGEIDLIVVNDEEIAILNHISLERIFCLYDQFTTKATEALTSIGRSKKIENYEAFQEDCLNDKRYQKILTKMLREGNDLSTCLNNFENVRETISMFGLEIEIRKYPNETIVYQDKNQIMDILRLIRDSYYLSMVRKLPGIDNKV